MPIKILIVDDHEVVRSGLRRIIEGQPSMEVCGEAQNGEEAIEKSLMLKPDVLLMDISMPVMSGIEATRQIRRARSGAKIVIVSLHDDPIIAEEAKKAGADAYVVKSSPSGVLLRTIKAVSAAGRGAARGANANRVLTVSPVD